MDENGKRQKAVSKRLASPAGKESVAGGKMRRLALRRPVKPQCAQLAIAQLRAANANQIQTAMRAGKQCCRALPRRRKAAFLALPRAVPTPAKENRRPHVSHEGGDTNDIGH